MSRLTLTQLHQMKVRQEKIAMLTAYDASFSHLLDKAGVDVLLVGDSLGMVVQGQDSTLPVTLTEMIYHCQNVVRGSKTAFIIADMPFMSYAYPEQAVKNAARLMAQGGAHMVKLEGGAVVADTVHALTQRGIPVCAHLGLLPQSVHKLGGYRVQARDDNGAQQLANEAQMLVEAGADMLILECVPAAVAEQLTASLSIPVIGIGAGNACDGQVLVLYDMLGLTPGQRPRFSHDFMQDAPSIEAAVSLYVEHVKSGAFPTKAHSF